MSVQRMVPVTVLGLAAALGVAWAVTLATGEAPPPDDAGYTTRRICVDPAATDQAGYLSGGELVGASFDADDFGLSGTLEELKVTDVQDGHEFRYFFVAPTPSAGSVQLSVSDVGASNVGLGFGLDLDADNDRVRDRVYPVRLTATDDSDPAESAVLDVGVWVDTSVTSTSGNGVCS